MPATAHQLYKSEKKAKRSDGVVSLVGQGIIHAVVMML